jgi:HIV Tat-specific factor 1
MFANFESYLFLWSRFGGRQIQAVEDDGTINHALVRDETEEAERLERFGAELEAD